MNSKKRESIFIKVCILPISRYVIGNDSRRYLLQLLIILQVFTCKQVKCQPVRLRLNFCDFILIEDLMLYEFNQS